MKRLVSAFLAGAMALSLAACGGSASTSTAASSAAASAAPASSAAADSDLAYIQSNGKMVIGYTVYEPMNYTDADGSFTGFDTELATAVCEKLGVEPEFVEINWDTKETELAAKSIDCIWNGLTFGDQSSHSLRRKPYFYGIVSSHGLFSAKMDPDALGEWTQFLLFSFRYSCAYTDLE